jgi:hypothetical protein
MKFLHELIPLTVSLIIIDDPHSNECKHKRFTLTVIFVSKFAFESRIPCYTPCVFSITYILESLQFVFIFG